MTDGDFLASKNILIRRLNYKTKQLEQAYTAYEELLKGGVQSYSIGSRNITKFDLAVLEQTIKKLEAEIDEIECEIEGKKTRKAFGVVPRDY